MSKWSIRNGTEIVVADDREALARLVGNLDAEDAEELSDDETAGEGSTAETTEDDGSGNVEAPDSDGSAESENASTESEETVNA